MARKGFGKAKLAEITGLADQVTGEGDERTDIQKDFAKYANDPVGFIEGELGEKLTEQQKILCLSVRDNRETNCQASHGVGKSHISSRLVLWWIYAVGGLAITTAPTKRQVEQILWGEIRRTFDRKSLPGERGMTFVRLTESARAYGFTASSTNSNAFQGVHFDKLLVVQDEACGISPEIDDGASACVTGGSNRLLRVGNPIVSGVPFEFACKRKHIRIPVWEHPNVAWAYERHDDGVHRLKPEVAEAILDASGEVTEQHLWAEWCPRDKIPGAVSIGWIEDVRAKKGETSAYWQTRVEGIFATDSEASVIPRSWFEAARARYDANPAHWDNLAAARQWQHGLDVGDGQDSHGFASWRGCVLYSVVEVQTKGDREDVSRATGLAKKLLESKPGHVAVDRGGVGSGALATLLEQKLNATGVHWGEAAKDPTQYLNSKAEDFWLLREDFRIGEIAIAPLGEYEEMLAEDWSNTHYEITSVGKTRIEDKSKTRKRLHRSPNVGDAAVIARRRQQRPVFHQSQATWSRSQFDFDS